MLLFQIFFDLIPKTEKIQKRQPSVKDIAHDVQEISDDKECDINAFGGNTELIFRRKAKHLSAQKNHRGKKKIE